MVSNSPERVWISRRRPGSKAAKREELILRLLEDGTWGESIELRGRAGLDSTAFSTTMKALIEDGIVELDRCQRQRRYRRVPGWTIGPISVAGVSPVEPASAGRGEVGTLPDGAASTGSRDGNSASTVIDFNARLSARIADREGRKYRGVGNQLGSLLFALIGPRITSFANVLDEELRDVDLAHREGRSLFEPRDPAALRGVLAEADENTQLVVLEIGALLMRVAIAAGEPTRHGG